MSRILYLPNPYSQQRQREKKRKIYPILMAMEAEYYRQQGHEVAWDTPDGIYDRVIREPEGLPFLKLPAPDRQFTRWWEYQDNGNFKHLPGTYIQSARDCWWGKCTFCQWTKKYPTYEMREPYDVISEIQDCAEMGFKEVFDDSGTFPIDTLRDFCEAAKYLDFKNRIKISCNWRLLQWEEWDVMKQAGFRMLLIGLESANQYTLDRINKGIDIKEAIHMLRDMAKAGLEPHPTVMFGFPWETEADALRTLDMVHHLLKKGYAKTAQASLYTVPDGENNPNHAKYINQIYDVWKSPEFWKNKIMDIKSTADIKYLGRQIREGLRSWR